MSIYRFINLNTGISLAGLLALSACGGGGGGTEGAATPTPATTVSGTAAKGLVRQARVLVCRIVKGAPEPDPSCATAISADDGSFTVSMTDGYTGPAVIKVVAGPATMMQDETTGGYIPYSMTMRAIVPAVSASTTAHVTPFSEMAANAVGATAIDAEKMRQAMATVQTLMAGLGVDLTVKPAVDLKNSGSDPALLGRQSNMVKQLTKVVMAAKNASSLTDANSVPCNAAGTSASQQVACAMNAMARVMTGAATTDQAKAAVVLAALNAQNVTTAYMPIIKADGTLDVEMTDMTSSQAMQTAMGRAGMDATAASGTVSGMMQRMR